jgi:type II secretory pathway pseudopilin PulG
MLQGGVREQMMRKIGLTLIELLIVISIIIILAALIFPVLALGRRKARDTNCISNLRNIGSALHIYAMDYNDNYPYAVDPTDRYTPNIWRTFFKNNPELAPKGITDASAWMQTMPLLHQVLYLYNKNKEIWLCQNDTGFNYMDINGAYLNARPTCYKKFGTSYIFRTEIAIRKMKVDTFDQGADINVVTDACGAWHTGEKIATQPNMVRVYAKTYRYNVLFSDLHVRTCTFDDLNKAWSTPLQKGMSPR